MTIGLGGEKLWLCPTLTASADDLSGNGNDGVYQNGMGIVNNTDSSYGGVYAYEFDGTDDHINCGNGLNPTAAITMSAWVYSDVLPIGSERQTIIEKGYDGTDEPFAFLFTGEGEVRGYTFDGSIHGNQVAHGVSAAQWNHFASTFDGSTWKMYKNGRLIETINDSTSLLTNSEDVRIGASSIDGVISRFWDGLMDDIRIYDRALAQREITHLSSQRGVEGPPPVGLGGETLWFSATNNPSGANQGSYSLQDIGLDNNGGSIGDLDGTNDSFLSPDRPSQWITPASYTSSNPSNCSIAFWFQAGLMNLSSAYGGLGTVTFEGLDFGIIKLNTEDEVIYWDDVDNVRRGVFVGTGTRFGQTLIHLAATYSVQLNEVKYYENGVLKSTANPSPPLSNLELTNKRWGVTLESSGGPTNAHQEDIRVYDRTLSDGEVAYLALEPNIEGGIAKGRLLLGVG